MAHGTASANPNDFILPDLGEGVHEAELLKWRVTVGQYVNELDILADMETDKAVVEVPSPRAGTIAALHGNEGDILHVGNPLVSFVPAGAAAPDSRSKGTPAPAAVPKSNSAAPAAEPAHREDAGTVVGAMPDSAAGVSNDGKALATPAVRRLARELGVDIDTVRGTGIAGRVTEKDVRNAAGGPPARGSAAPAPSRAGSHPDVAPADREEPHSAVVAGPAARAPQTRAAQTAPAAPAARRAPEPAAQRSAPERRAPAAADETTRIPFRGVRRTIAGRLRESVNRAVHFNVMDEADVSALDAMRRKLGAASGEKVSFLPFVASAVCRVLASPEFSAMNSTVDENPEDPNYDAAIEQHRTVHLGIATDTESGLMVPVIRDCDSLGVLQIAREIGAIAAAARSRTIPRDQLLGSTFTISNVGSHAGRFATPIINYPEVGILAVGRARQAPVIRTTSTEWGGAPAIAIGQLLPLSLACDHRVVDGATAALALAKIIELLQDPEQLLGPARG